MYTLSNDVSRKEQSFVVNSPRCVIQRHMLIGILCEGLKL